VPELVEMISEVRGGTVGVVLSPAARPFVPRLRGVAVYDDRMWRRVPLHVTLPLGATLFVVAPTTANTLAKAAYGLADNLLTATILAWRAPVVFFPAMNAAMWDSSAVRRNVQSLRDDGHRVAVPIDCESASTGVLGDAVGFSVESVRAEILSFGELPPADNPWP
jgi:phosphopantothenoylcysteine synthetase/decarboxylase